MYHTRSSSGDFIALCLIKYRVNFCFIPRKTDIYLETPLPTRFTVTTTHIKIKSILAFFPWNFTKSFVYLRTTGSRSLPINPKEPYLIAGC